MKNNLFFLKLSPKNLKLINPCKLNHIIISVNFNAHLTVGCLRHIQKLSPNQPTCLSQEIVPMNILSITMAMTSTMVLRTSSPIPQVAESLASSSMDQNTLHFIPTPTVAGVRAHQAIQASHHLDKILIKLHNVVQDCVSIISCSVPSTHPQKVHVNL